MKGFELLDSNARKSSDDSILSDTAAEVASDTLVLRFTPVDEGTIEHLKTLNRVIFPVKYQDTFYRQCTAAGSVTQLVFHEQSLVGAIACRLEAQEHGLAKLYIMTLGVLAPYRKLGIGSRLLHRSLAEARTDPNILSPYLHVHVANEEAIRFYLNNGFTLGPVIRRYYKRIEPPDAVTLSKQLW